MQAKLRRVLSVLAVLAMLCTLLPLSAISVAAEATIANADFESGTVTVTKSGSGYKVTVDAKCGSHTIKATYTGELLPSEVVYGQSPKLHKYHTKSHRQTVGKERRMSR